MKLTFFFEDLQNAKVAVNKIILNFTAPKLRNKKYCFNPLSVLGNI